MHGIFFGSNDEIEFAHREGFLFELFRDTGFYMMTSDMKKNNLVLIESNKILNNKYTNASEGNSDEIDFEDLIKSIENTYYDYTVNEEQYGAAIDHVANTNFKNDLKKVKSFSHIDNFKRSKFFRNISSESFNENNSGSSSLLSINKDSYCRHYVNNHNNGSNDGVRKAYDIDLKQLLKNKTDEASDENFASTSTESMKKFTPPGDVLATINTWLKKTKEAINTRNTLIKSQHSI